jgi:hypothetical protein
MDEYPMPGMEIDPRELEKAKYMALMRMGLGMAGREPLGRAVQGGINTYFAGDESARRNADQKMQEMRAKMQYAIEMNKESLAAKKQAEMAEYFKNFDPSQFYAAGGSPQELEYAKKNPAHMEKIFERLKTQKLGPGDMIYVPGVGFIDGVPKDGMVNIIDPDTFKVVGTKRLAGHTLAMAEQAAAVKAAEQANMLQTIQGPKGPQSQWGADIAGGPPALRGQAAPQQAGQQPPRFNFQNQSPEGARAVLADLQNPAPWPKDSQPSSNVVYGQDPMAVKRAEQGGAAIMEFSKPIFEDQRKLTTAATALAKNVNNMERLDAGGVYSGPTGFLWEKFGSAWNNALPESAKGLEINPEKLANTQTFTSEVSKMQQALGKAFPGQQSNYELQVVTNALPQLMLTPEGRAKIYAVIRSAAKYEQENYASMAAHAKQNQGDLTEWRPLPFPEPPKELGLRQGEVAGKIGNKGNATVTAFPKGPPVGTVINGKRFKGGDPNDRANWE